MAKKKSKKQKTIRTASIAAQKSPKDRAKRETKAIRKVWPGSA